jgi:hypothetical protein
VILLGGTQWPVSRSKSLAWLGDIGDPSIVRPFSREVYFSGATGSVNWPLGGRVFEDVKVKVLRIVKLSFLKTRQHQSFRPVEVGFIHEAQVSRRRLEPLVER